jgi:hypothetical protein
MSETVVLPPEGTRRLRRQGMLIPPLLLIPFLVYNLIAFTAYGGNPARWTEGGLFSLTMVSGTPWTLTAGDLMLVLGLACLFVEILKSTNTGRNSVIEHMLSVALLIVFLIMFLLVPACASSTFFLLMVMALVDVVAGFTISITGAGRDVTMA